MAVIFFGTIFGTGATTYAEGVASAAGTGDATGLSVAPATGAASASGTVTAEAVGAFSNIHHIALPRPAPGETDCDCVSGSDSTTSDTTVFPDASN